MKIVSLNGKLLADSREVAEMVNKPHNDLMKSIRTYCEYLGQGDFPQSQFFIESTYFNSQNKEQPCYLLTRKGCDMVANKMTGEKGVLFTATYVTKFEEMERQLANPFNIPQTYAESLRLAADLTEHNERLLLENAEKERQLALQAPKVALYDTAMSAGNDMTMGHIAKSLNIGRNILFKKLREAKILMANNLPYQQYIDRGYFNVRQYSITHLTSGIENKTQTLVTAKGMAYIHKLIQDGVNKTA